MTRAILNPLAGELEAQAKAAMYKQTDFFIVPTWIDDSLRAHGMTESILSDKDMVNSILTEDDIKFYNQQLSSLNSVLNALPLPKDIEFKYLQSNKKHYGMDIPAIEDSSYEENSIGRKERLSPFIKDAQSVSAEKLWNIVASYNINKLADRTQVVVRLSIVPFEDVLPLQLKQDEKLGIFLIEEYGLTFVAGTHLFKKLLDFKSCY